MTSPLIAAMSTALPTECSDTLPEAVRYEWPHCSDEIVGLKPLATRNSSVASTRRSIVPAWMSWRPQP